MKKIIIVSAVNVTEAGPLSILKDCLGVLDKDFSQFYDIVALVYSESLFNIENVTFIEFPNTKKSYFRKFYYEYLYFKKISKKMNPFLWISLSDITPNVQSKKRVVYCHNAAIFFKWNFKDLFYTTPTVIQSFAYRLFYRINIKKNNYVIVQQDWLRSAFVEKWRLKNVIVCYPTIDNKYLNSIPKTNNPKNSQKKKFFFPSFPRGFKNFELVCDAYKLLNNNLKSKAEIILTVDENISSSYAKYLINKYNGIEGIRFIGLITREEVFEYYNEVDCLVFPSKLESWGLPITEFKHFNKPIFLADLPYAYETLGEYRKAHFFNPYSPKELSLLMEKLIEEKLEENYHEKVEVDEPFCIGWNTLLNKIINE